MGNGFMQPFALWKNEHKPSNDTHAVNAEIDLQNHLVLRLNQLEDAQKETTASVKREMAAVLERIMSPVDTVDIDVPAGTVVRWFPPEHRYWILESITVYPATIAGAIGGVSVGGVRGRAIPLVAGDNVLKVPITSSNQIVLTGGANDTICLIHWRRYTKVERVISGEDTT